VIGNRKRLHAEVRVGRVHGRRRGVDCPAVVVALTVLNAVNLSGSASVAQTFTNVTAAVGINHVQSTSYGTQAMTGGVAAGDFDGDGRVDLFFTRVGAPPVLYHNTGSGFEDVSAAAGFTTTLPTNGAAFGDIDNDGHLDLYVTTSQSNQYLLYMNDGAGHFTEQAVARGAAVTSPDSTNRQGQGVAFGDYDGDGYLDILTTDFSRPTATSGSRLLRNLGAANPGHFEDVTHAAGLDVYRTPLAVADTSYRYTPQFADIDHDGHPDIVFSADSHTSQLFWNNGNGTFTDGTVAAGVGTDKSGMGSALGDYNGDGNLDWFISAIYDTTFLGSNPGNRLYRNNGNRTFTDVTTAAGVRNTGPGLSWGWGTAFFDYDNDAHLDLIATDGFIAGSGYGVDRTTLWRNNANGTFTDVSLAAGITDTGQGRGLISLDYNGDGQLDVVVVNYASAPILYRNNGENSGHWLRVKTEGTRSNRDGIGAFITLVADAAQPEQLQVREIGSGDSFLSQSELVAHFGLGSLSHAVDLVEVDWPASGLVQRYVDVPVDTLLTARERLLGDFDGDGIVDAADYTVWKDSFGMTGSGLAADTAGANGLPDGTVDVIDYLYWKANYGLHWNHTLLIEAGAGSQASSVPEPNGFRLLTMWIGIVCCGRLRLGRFVPPVQWN
jgi:hypothetical protein